jgi:predicted nucleic-acid-binding protein
MHRHSTRLASSKGQIVLPTAAAALAERAFVPVTVLAESEWVMRGFYDLPPREVSRVWRALTGIELLTIDDRGAVLTALDASDHRLDFADALHLARSARASTLLSFDQRLAKRVQGLALLPAVAVLV